MDHRHRQLPTLDHDFRARTHPREQPSEVIGGFRFRDVDHMVSHATIIPSFPVFRFQPLRPHKPTFPSKETSLLAKVLLTGSSNHKIGTHVLVDLVCAAHWVRSVTYSYSPGKAEADVNVLTLR